MSAKVFEGTVSSNKMQKTLVVTVTRQFQESRTGKIVYRDSKYKVHCESPDVAVGDKVEFSECRPMSKDKKFRFLKITRKIQQALETKDEVN
jgi:small subunit ribosomal protein S17